MVDRSQLLAQMEPIVIAFRNAMLSRVDRLERRLSLLKGRKARIEAIRADTLDALSILADLFSGGEEESRGKTSRRKSNWETLEKWRKE
jgi:hypothetical protein